MTDEQVEQVIADVRAVVEEHRRPRWSVVPEAALGHPAPG
jgi:uncharacterized protein YejL (UPF0352 family)